MAREMTAEYHPSHPLYVAPVTEAVVDDAPADEAVTADRESLKAILKEAGVSFGGNTSTEKLAEMVANLTVENPDT